MAKLDTLNTSTKGLPVYSCFDLCLRHSGWFLVFIWLVVLVL